MADVFVITVASNLVSKLGECLLAPIGRQFGYVLFYKRYTKDLEDGVNKLNGVRSRVQHSVDDAIYDSIVIPKEVETWLTSVKEETDKANDLLKRKGSAKDACFRGWLPNPVVRYPIGKKAEKITQVIQRLHQESKDGTFQEDLYENTPIGKVIATTSATRSTHRKEDVQESRTTIIKNVIKAITDDKACVIGVYGPGGVGKSRLMEDVERRVREEQLFNYVVMINVSRNPDLKKIQGEIAYALDLKLADEETTFGRADLLCRSLRKLGKRDENKILIILDNLWTKLELKEVGIPCEYDNKVRGCKLLLTSRYRDVLYAEMGSDREFQLNVLKHEEARKLFESTVGNIVDDPQFKNFVERVVRNCGGWPLLIVSVAKRLKRGDLTAWRNASTNIEASSVKSIVQQNYNDLKDERIKSLFLVQALFGISSLRDTLVTCMGLGLFKTISKTIENARDRLIMDLRHLLDSSLLLSGDDMQWLSMHDVRDRDISKINLLDISISLTHDFVIDVAISMHGKFIDTEWNTLVGRKDFGFKQWSKNDLRKCTAMAFKHVGIDELPKELDCPDMRILLLFEHNSPLKMPDSFFESMKKLQVLNLFGLSFTSLPSSIEFLENLKSLCLDECYLDDVTAIGKLKGLQFLSFLNSTIARLTTKEMGGLMELRFLDLRGCTKLRLIERGMLKSLVNLEELYMQNSFYQWEAKDKTPPSNASLAELKNMEKLSTLCIDIPHPTNLSLDLPFEKLKMDKIEIEGIQRWRSVTKNAETQAGFRQSSP